MNNLILVWFLGSLAKEDLHDPRPIWTSEVYSHKMLEDKFKKIRNQK